MATLERYSFGSVVIDGREHTRDVIVLPRRVLGGWRRRQGHSLEIADLREVLDELPRRLILGCGAHGRLTPRADALEELAGRGVEVEVLPTAEAVRRYAQLDERETAAALHLTC